MFVILILSSIIMMSFLVSVKASISEIDNALNNAILYLEDVQKTSQGHEGEFATYRWLLPSQIDKEYNFTVFTTPFVLYTLNLLTRTHSDLAQVGTSAFENMRSLAATFLLSNVETLEGHTGIWRFYGPGSDLPPDLDSTCCNLECLLSFNPALWGDPISGDLTDYFLNYRRVDGAFYTWFEVPSDVCAGTTANVLFFYAARNEEHRIQTTMDWLNDQIDKMILGLAYHELYYRSPYAFTYFVARAYTDGGAETFLSASQREDIRNYILADQEADGSWPTYSEYVGPEDELETALALISLINLGFSELTSSEQANVEKGIEYLLNAQNPDGSWPCACFYLGGPPKIYFGSKEHTTAICMEALAKYARTTSWTTTMAVSTQSTEDSYDPSSAVDSSGNVHIAWTDETSYLGSGTDKDIFYRRYEPGSGWITVDVVSTQNTGYSINPSLAVDWQGNAHVVWEDNTNYEDCGNDFDVFYKRWQVAQGTWTNTEVVSIGSDAWSGEPAVAVDSDGMVHVVWSDGTNYESCGTDYDVFYKRYDPGSGWGDVVVVSTESTESSLFLSIAVGPDDAVHVVWSDLTNYESCGIEYDVFYKRYDPSSGLGNLVVVSTESTGNSLFPSVAADSLNNVHIAWHDLTNYAGSGTDSDIFYKRYETGSGWTTTKIVSTESTGNSEEPSVVADSNGNTHIAWTDETDYLNSETDKDIFYKQGELPTYTLTITRSDGGTTVPVPETYKYIRRRTISVTAIPFAGYRFDHWELDGSNVGDNNPYSVFMDRNHDLHAVFESLPPACQVSPTSLNFGTVYLGSHRDKTFTITNTGGGTLTGTVSESCSHYSIVSGGGSYSLGAGQSVTVTVRFAPTEEKTYTCTIETGTGICSDVSCTGTGYEPTGVGGVIIPIDKLGLLAPYIISTSIIAVTATATIIYAKRKSKHRKTKNK